MGRAIFWSIAESWESKQGNHILRTFDNPEVLSVGPVNIDIGLCQEIKGKFFKFKGDWVSC